MISLDKLNSYKNSLKDFASKNEIEDKAPAVVALLDEMLTYRYTQDLIRETKIPLVVGSILKTTKLVVIKERCESLKKLFIGQSPSPPITNVVNTESENVMKRKRCEKIFSEELESQGVASNNAIIISRRIMEVVFSSFPEPEKQHIELINFIRNSKINSEFKIVERLKDGTLKPEDFAQYTKDDVKTSKLIEQEKKLKEESDKLVAIPHPKMEATRQFTCKHCKSKNTYHSQLQIRSADEGMTSIVTCIDCGKTSRYN